MPTRNFDPKEVEDLRRELEALMDAADINQTELASLLGQWPMTVTRWLARKELKNDLPPPFYAINFMRAFVMLPANMRRQLPRRKVMNRRSKVDKTESD